MDFAVSERNIFTDILSWKQSWSNLWASLYMRIFGVPTSPIHPQASFRLWVKFSLSSLLNSVFSVDEQECQFCCKGFKLDKCLSSWKLLKFFDTNKSTMKVEKKTQQRSSRWSWRRSQAYWNLFTIFTESNGKCLSVNKDLLKIMMFILILKGIIAF